MRYQTKILFIFLLFCWFHLSIEEKIVGSVAASGSSIFQTIVVVNFTDETTQQARVLIQDLDTGIAIGQSFSLKFEGSSTFPDTSTGNTAIWTFTTSKPVRNILIDLSDANAAFDSGNLLFAPLIQTPRSANGLYCQIVNATPPFDSLPLLSYSGIPDVFQRHEDLWNTLNIFFDFGYTGTFFFRAGVVLLAERLSLCSLPSIQGTGVDYAPYLSTTPSPIFSENGEKYLHLEVTAVSTLDRRSGIEPSEGTWITFLTPENPGCIAGINYFWTHSRSAAGSYCLDVYSLDIPLDVALQSCNLNYAANSTSYIVGALNIRSIVDRIDYTSGSFTYVPYSQTSQISFSINLANVSASLNVTIIAPVVTAGAIEGYNIPTGEEDKVIYIQTFLQNPPTNGLRLVYEESVGTVTRIALPDVTSDPTPSDIRLTQTWTELSDGCEFAFSIESPNHVVTYCTQRWSLTISVANALPPICVLSDLFFQVPFTIVCDSTICQTIPNDTSTSLTVQVSTPNFCPIILADYSFIGSITPFYNDFSEQHLGFFQESEVGFEIKIEDSLGSSLQNSIQSIRMTYLAAILGDGINPSDIFPPNIYTFLRSGGTGAILIGSDPNEGYTDQFLVAGLNPNVCNLYPQTGYTGCSPDVLRFSFYLRRLLWDIPADKSSILRVGVILVLDLGLGIKKTVWASSPNGVSTWSSLMIQPGVAPISPSRGPSIVRPSPDSPNSNVVNDKPSDGVVPSISFVLLLCLFWIYLL